MPLQTLRQMGLDVRLAEDGRAFTVRGLGSLPPERAEEARALCRFRREAILRQLGAPAPQPARPEGETWCPRDFWPLCRRYTSTEQIGQVVRAWGLELEADEGDFRLARKQKPELHPQLMVFFRANAPLINRFLREGAAHA